LIIAPWLAVNAIRDEADLRRAIGLIGALIVVKAALGLIGVLTHVGVGAHVADAANVAVSSSGTTITYYEAPANWLAMTFILAVLASVASHLPVGRLARWALLLVVLSLVFSLRRSFWIGTVAAVPVLLVMTSPLSRRLLPPAAAVLAAALWLTISSGFVIDSQTPVVQRIQSLTPSRLTTNPQDRYRLDERKNVLAEIRASPLVGLGLAVPWQERYPLSVETQVGGGRLYVHMALLWYWLKLGIVGLIAYSAYMLTAIIVGIQIFRRHHDARIRVAGAGVAAGLVGLAVVETTGTFVGVDLRMSVLIGCVVGLLAVGWSQTRSAAAPSPYTPADARARTRPPAVHVSAPRS